MTNRKLSETATVIAIAALVLTVFAPGVFAQGKHFTFQIPFDFYVGGRLMPAGNYTVEHNTSAGAAQIYDRDGHITTVLPQTSTNNVIGNNRMVFNRYGSMTFLSEIQWANSGTGYRIRESKLEHETRLGTSPVKVAVQPGK